MGKRVINEEGGSGIEGQRRRRQKRVRKSNRAENPLGRRHSSVSVSPWRVKTGGYTNMVTEREGRRLGLGKRIHREVRAHSTRRALKLGVCHQCRYNVISAPEKNKIRLHGSFGLTPTGRFDSSRFGFFFFNSTVCEK